MTDCFVYFIRPVGFAGPIKIGCSGVPVARLRSLMSLSPFPLEIVTKVPGGLKLEANIHSCLSDSHSHAEWFHATAETLTVVERLQKGVPIEDALDLSKTKVTLHSKRQRRRARTIIERQFASLNARVIFAIRRWESSNNSRIFAPSNISGALDKLKAQGIPPVNLNEIEAFIADPSSSGLTMAQWCASLDRPAQPVEATGDAA